MTTTTAAVNAGCSNLWIAYKYDYLGRRVEKKVTNLAANGGVITWRRFLYKGWSIVAEFKVDPANGALTLYRSYTWGLDIARSLSDAGGVGALVQIADHLTGKRFLPTYDGNGNVITIVNASTGAIAASYEYSPYGETITATTNDSSVADQPFRFSTKYLDQETGNYDYGRRYYSPSQGRFLGRDPKGEEGGINLFTFCLNNATNLWDVLGMDIWLNNAYSMRSDGSVYFDYGRVMYGQGRPATNILYQNSLSTVGLINWSSPGSLVRVVNGRDWTSSVPAGNVSAGSFTDVDTGVTWGDGIYWTSANRIYTTTTAYGDKGGSGGPTITLPSSLYQNGRSLTTSNPQNTTMAGLRDDIVMALQGIDNLTGTTRFFSDSAVALLLGTAAQESGGLKNRVQSGGGPARGVFQMEKATYDDIWNNYLEKHPRIADTIKDLFTPAGGSLSFDMIQADDAYAAVMARLRYAAYSTTPLPDVTDVTGLANYWKNNYNTSAGKGTSAQFIESFNTYVAPMFPPPNSDGSGGGG